MQSVAGLQLTQAVENRRFPHKLMVRPSPLFWFSNPQVACSNHAGRANFKGKNMTNHKNLLMISVVAVLLSACATPRPATPPAAPVPVVPAEASVLGAPVTLVNTQFGFVVLNYSSRVMPAVGTRLSIYRGQQRVGAVRITEPVRSRFATADVLEGELQAGDEAR
jgi:hypothetical protein